MRLIGWDLETTNLSAIMGRILCCSFKVIQPDRKGEIITLRGDDRKYRRPDITDDGDLCQAIRDKLESYDVIVGHNSKLFDRKFLNARLLRAGARPLAPQFHIDTMWLIRTHFRISSKLDNVQKYLKLPDEKTPISWDDWQRAAGFDRNAMDKIVEHNIKDVIVLEQAYWKLLPSMRTLQRG